MCEKRMTAEEEVKYKNLCYSCCSLAWSLYEEAHGYKSTKHVKRAPISKKTKEYIVNRDKCCLICGKESDLTIDHIIPVASGGDNHHTNLQLLCRGCNSKKSDYPADYREVIEL